MSRKATPERGNLRNGLREACDPPPRHPGAEIRPRASADSPATDRPGRRCGNAGPARGRSRPPPHGRALARETHQKGLSHPARAAAHTPWRIEKGAFPVADAEAPQRPAAYPPASSIPTNSTEERPPHRTRYRRRRAHQRHMPRSCLVTPNAAQGSPGRPARQTTSTTLRRRPRTGDIRNERAGTALRTQTQESPGVNAPGIDAGRPHTGSQNHTEHRLHPR